MEVEQSENETTNSNYSLRSTQRIVNPEDLLVCPPDDLIFCIETTTITNSSPFNRSMLSLNNEDVHNGILSFAHVFEEYKLEMRYKKNLKLFFDSLINKVREAYSVYLLRYVFCIFCGDVVKDPVFLDCGHTYSKQCLLRKNRRKTDITCPDCNQTCTLSQLHSNVHVTNFIEKVWQNPVDSSSEHSILRELLSSVIQTQSDVDLAGVKAQSFSQNPTPRSFFRKSVTVSRLQRFSDVIYLRLVYCLFVPGDTEVKNSIVDMIQKLIREENFGVCSTITNFCNNMEKLIETDVLQDRNGMNVFTLSDFECTWCKDMVLEPVTTPCGHIYCRVCLLKCLDFQTICASCKFDLESLAKDQRNFLSEPKRPVNEFIESITKQTFNPEYARHKFSYHRYMRELFDTSRKDEGHLPVVLMTHDVAYPDIEYNWKVTADQYKILIRQCIDSGFLKFGLCLSSSDGKYTNCGGVVLKFKKVTYLSDGVIEFKGVAEERFLLKEYGVGRDGYMIAHVKYVYDTPINPHQREHIRKMHKEIFNLVTRWVFKMDRSRQEQISWLFGPIPHPPNYGNYSEVPAVGGPSWLWWALAIMKISTGIKNKILFHRSLFTRFIFIRNMMFNFHRISSFQNL